MFDILAPTWIQDLVQAYGLWVLFAVVMCESMGVPMPGETALVAAALYAGSTHRIGILSVVIVAATAAVVGDNLGYLIGRSIGGKYVGRQCDGAGRRSQLRELVERVGAGPDRRRPPGRVGGRARGRATR